MVDSIETEDPLAVATLNVLLDTFRKHTRPAPFATRRLPKGMEKQIRRYAQDIGLVMWAWNRLHAHVFEIFWYVLTGSDRPAQGHALAVGLWHQIQNDSTQREMLIEAARVELSSNPAALTRLEWLLARIKDLSKYRNVAAHVDAVFSPHMRKRPAGNPVASRLQYGMRFDLIDHRRFWKIFAGDLNILGHYALRLSRPIYGFPEPWPRKPKLLTPPLISKIEGEIGRRTRRPPPQRQPPASRGKHKGRQK